VLAVPVIELWRLLSKVPPELRQVIVAVVRAIVMSPNPHDAALRALEEQARLRAFDQLMRRVGK
jgi:hypothetical protein